MKKSKIILIITIILLIILAIFTGIKIYQYKTLEKIGYAIYGKRDTLNYYYEVKPDSPSDSAVPASKVYVKDNKVRYENLDDNGQTIWIAYSDTDTQSTYLVYENSKSYSKFDRILIGPGFGNLPSNIIIPSLEDEVKFIDRIKLALSIKSITHEKLNDIETIKIHCNDKNGFETSWYDANTLYPMRIESDTYLTNVNYYMSDCPLSDEEMTFTDFNNYEEVIDDEYN